MLVLSRKTRQQIRIGDDIIVTILLVKGQVVRVGIEAPRDVRVLRAELPVFDDEPVAQPSTKAAIAKSKVVVVDTTEHAPETTRSPRRVRTDAASRNLAGTTRASPPRQPRRVDASWKPTGLDGLTTVV